MVDLRWACILVLLASTAFAEAPKKHKVVADRVVAVVNDGVILASEVELRLATLRNQAASITDETERERRIQKLARQLLDSMIDDELVVQAALEARLTVEEKEIDDAIEFLKTEHKLDDEQLKEAMRVQGMSRATLKNDILRQRAVAHLVAPKVQITDDDIRGRYDEMQRRSNTVTAVNLSQIVIQLPEHPTEQQLRDAKDRAGWVLERIKAGEPFATVATEVTDDATTKATGGMLGWFQPGTVVPEWEQVVFGMERGDVRGPVPGDRGLYLFFANDVKRTPIKPLAEMKDTISNELRRKALGKLTQTWIEELRKKAYIDIKLK